MKKIALVGLILALCLCFTACDNNGKTNSNGSSTLSDDLNKGASDLSDDISRGASDLSDDISRGASDLSDDQRRTQRFKPG